MTGIKMFTWLKIVKLQLIEWIIIIDFTSFNETNIEKKFHLSVSTGVPQGLHLRFPVKLSVQPLVICYRVYPTLRVFSSFQQTLMLNSWRKKSFERDCPPQQTLVQAQTPSIKKNQPSCIVVYHFNFGWCGLTGSTDTRNTFFFFK